MGKKAGRYHRLIEAVFFRHYRPGAEEVSFSRSEIAKVADELQMELPKNLGDVVYSFRYRAKLPESIRQEAPPGCEWIIRPVGRAEYRFVLTARATIVPSRILVETKIPDATPGVIDEYALSDEQALLARLRYNRLVDIFTSLTCYSLQNHLRTTVPRMGQVETDEIYIGIDARGAHYVLPVEAKGRTGRIGAVQIEQNMAVCATKFPDLICRPIAAQSIDNDMIALFELVQTQEGIAVSSEKHYRLVHPEDLSPEELQDYRRRPL